MTAGMRYEWGHVAGARGFARARVSARAPAGAAAAVLFASTICGAIAASARGAEAPSLEEEIRIRLRAGERVKRAHDALLAFDSGSAVGHLRAALALMQRLQAGESREIEVEPPMGGAGGAPMEADPSLSNVAYLLEARAAPAGFESQFSVQGFGPEYQRDLAISEKVRELRDRTRELAQEQRRLAQEIAGAAAGGRARPDEASDASHPEGKASQERSAQGAPGGEAQAAQGASQRGRSSADELASRETSVAQAAAQVADGLRALEQDLPVAAQIAEQFLAAAAAASSAAGSLSRGRFDEAAARAELAAQRLEATLGQLGTLPREEAERLIDALQGKLERVVAEQGGLAARTEALARDPGAGGMNSPAALGELRSIAQAQDGLRLEMESAEQALGELRRWAELEAGHETRSALAAAGEAARRERISQRMTDAVVELGSQDPAGAARSERAALAGAARVLERVQDAFRSMASDPLSELKAAALEAGRVERNLEELGAEPAEGAAGGSDEGSSPATRRATAADAAAQAGRLVRRVRARGWPVPEADIEALSRVAREGPNRFASQVERGEAPLGQLLGAARRVRDRLEAEHRSQLEARRLFESQREECPPQYRQIVNRYFERLSELGNAPQDSGRR